MAWLRNRGDEDAAAAARGQVAHPKPVVLELGRRNQVEVQIVCARLEAEGWAIACYFQSPNIRGGGSFLGRVDAFVVVRPEDRDHVAAELVAAGLL